MEIQVNKEHYNFNEYTDSNRWMSYYCQIREAVSSGCKNILYIGKGDGIVCEVLKSLGGGIKVTTFDFDPALSPDIVGDLTDIGHLFTRKQYDCVMCCEVLEHLPFFYFEKILIQLKEICKETVIVSLPDRSMYFRGNFIVPKIRMKWMFSIIRFWEKEISFNGEHYWEVGNLRYTKSKLLNIFKRYFCLVRQYNVFENPYHWFVVLHCSLESRERET